MASILIFFATLFVTLCAYYAFPKKYRFIVLIIASLTFFVIMSKFLVCFIAFTITTVYFAARWIQKNNDSTLLDEHKEDKEYAKKIAKYNKAIITVTIILNLAIIGLLKYFQFFGSIVTGIFSWFDVEET